MSDAATTWCALSEPWQVCLDEAWRSWAAGSAGVGCAITDPAGAVVATGRNRTMEQKQAPHDLAGTPIAHAETVALSRLPFGDYTAHTLYTSFEPCMMCASTILLVGVGTVAYAAADPLFEGLHDWFGELEWSARRRPERVVLGGPAGAFAHLLHLSWITFWIADGPVVEAHRRASERHLDAARDLGRDGRLAAVADAGGTAVDALSAIWDTVVAVAAD